MPVIVERADWRVLLGEERLRPLPADWLRIWPVDRDVNSVKNGGPELLQAHSARVEELVLL